MTFRSWIRKRFATPAGRTLPKAPPRHRPALEALEDRLSPAVLTVNTLADTIAPDAFTSLREAITAANTMPGDDTINFSVTGTINLTGALPDLTSNLAIQGPGPGSLTVRRDTGGNYRIFTVTGGTTIALSGLTINNGLILGFPLGIGGGIYNGGTLTVSNSILSDNGAQVGGGIRNDGTLTVSNSTLSGNGAAVAGGISNGGTMTISNSTVSGNSAGLGAGIANGGTLTVSNSTLSGNSAFSEGGGIVNGGTLTVSNSTLSGNSAGFGAGGILNGFLATATVSNSTLSGNSATAHAGGIFNDGTLTLSNSTLSGNSATAGGGIANGGTLTVSNSTLSGNSAFTGGGGGISAGGSVTLNNSIVANSPSGGDVVGTVTGSNNLFGTVTLGPLQFNGGPTRTHALPAGSPAINAGNNALAIAAGLTTDQRGFARISGGTVDIGAYEAQAPTVTVPGAQTAFEDVDLAIGGGISVADGDSASLTVTLSVGQGTLTLGTTSGLTVGGNGTASVTLSGSLANLNAALASLLYRGNLNYGGPDALSITANHGSFSTSASVAITVKSAAQQAADLQAQVHALHTAGVLNQGQANSLNAKLNLHDNPGDIGRVQSFLNEVSGLLNAGILTQAQANLLLGPGTILLISVTRR